MDVVTYREQHICSDIVSILNSAKDTRQRRAKACKLAAELTGMAFGRSMPDALLRASSWKIQ